MVNIEDVIPMLDKILKDRTVPKNIKAAVEKSKNILLGDAEPIVKISAAINTLDEATNNPNVPIYARTRIWNVVTALEEKRKELS